MLDRSAEIESTLIYLFKSLSTQELEKLESGGGRVYIDGKEAGISYGSPDEHCNHAEIQYLPNVKLAVSSERFAAEEFLGVLLASVEACAADLEVAEEMIAARAD